MGPTSALRRDKPSFRLCVRGFSPRAIVHIGIPLLRWGSIAAAVALGIGCVDTRKELEEFQERYEATQGGPTDGGPACTGQARAAEISGQFLLAVSPAFSRPTPILLRATIEAQDAGSEVRFTMGLQALSATDRTTEAQSAQRPGNPTNCLCPLSLCGKVLRLR